MHPVTLRRGRCIQYKRHRIGQLELVTFTYASDLGSGIVASGKIKRARGWGAKMARLGRGKISISKISGILVGINRNDLTGTTHTNTHVSRLPLSSIIIRFCAPAISLINKPDLLQSRINPDVHILQQAEYVIHKFLILLVVPSYHSLDHSSPHCSHMTLGSLRQRSL